MGYQELIDSLRQEGEEQVRLIRSAAEAEAERLRQDAATRTEALRHASRERQAAAVAAELQDLLAVAQRQAALVRLEAEQLLAKRLYVLARQALSLLRGDNYAEMFGALMAELPASAWEGVRVNPADLELARAALPTAWPEADKGITGGLVVTAKEGRVQIDNSLEKRLERGWPILLTRLLDTIAPEE